MMRRHLWSGTWPDEYCIRCRARPPADVDLNSGELIDDFCPGYPDLYVHWTDPETGEHRQVPYSIRKGDE